MLGKIKSDGTLELIPPKSGENIAKLQEKMRRKVEKYRERIIRKQMEIISKFNEFLERVGKNTRDSFS